MPPVPLEIEFETVRERPVHQVPRRGRHAEAVARPADRIDLFDEADRAPFLARRLPQSLEERTDPGRRHPEPHRLQGGRRDEQERHAGLLGHRLGQVRLAGAGRSLEQHAAPRRAAELVAERRVPEEHVERPQHLVDLPVEALDLGEAELHLLRVDRDVRRLAVHQRHQDHQQDREHQDEGGEEDHPVVGQAGEPDGVVGRVAVPEVRIEHGDDHEQPEHLAPAGAFALREHVGPAPLEQGGCFQMRGDGRFLDLSHGSRPSLLAHGICGFEGPKVHPRTSPGIGPSAPTGGPKGSWRMDHSRTVRGGFRV